MKRKSPLGIALLGILLVSFLQLTLFIRPGKSDNGLLGLWNFDEGSGTVAHDSSDNGNDGILCNGPTRVNGKSGRALNFNGVDQYVEVAGNTDLNPHRSDWTVSAWVNIASLSVGPLSCGNYGFVIAGKRQDPYQEGLTLLAHWGSSATSQAKFCFIFDQPHAISGALTPLMNVFGWHYVVGVRNGANLTVYVDGVAYGPNNYAEGNPSPIDSDISSDTPLQFAHHGAWGEYDNGTIDEVRIYDRALSQQEIQSCMDPNSIKHYADDFSVDTGLWTYCGNAYRDNVSDDVVLTEAVNAQAGGIWLNESLRSSFTVKFKYWVGGTTGARTDGFVVKFYKQIDYSLPKGGYLGFSGLGYGIEFDTFRNDWDPSEDHIALIKDSWSNHLAWVDDARVSDDSWHNVTITVATSSIVVYLDSGRILSWNGTIDTTYGGFGFCGTTGEASWPTNDRHIIDDFSIDAPASQFDISITPAAISTSIGGKTRFAVTVDNQGGVTDIFNLNTFGLNSAWVNLSRDSIYLIAGQAAEIDLAISVPEDPFVVGTYPFCVIAQESLGVEKNASSQLTVFLNPIITNLAPENNTIIGSTDTLFSWCTSSNASSEVYIKQAGDLTFNNIIGAPGESHYISASNLTRNADYLWYAYSETANGNVSSDIRALHVSNGISFAQNVYAFNVERDYAQQASVSVINTDTESHQLLLQAINPYDDLIVGFVGPGSTDENLTIGPGETRSVAFNIFAQDAMQRNYTFTIKLTNLGPEQITDYALVNVNVRQPNVNLALIEESTDPATLSKTMTATNYGDPITDLYMDTSDELAGKVSFEPTVSHAYLPTGGSLTFKVVPVLTTDFTGIEGLITATSAGQVVASLPVNFTLPPGKSVFTIGVPTVSIEFSQYYDNDSSPNTNPLPVSPVETYIVNGSRVFASQIIVDVYQDGGPASDANVSLTVWNATGEILSVDDSQTDFTGKAMFVVFGQAGNYSYQAELVGYGLKTERRNFSTEFTSLFALHPNAISWLDISDRNSTYDLSQNVSRVTLEHAPFVFRGQKATIEDNTTATLYLRWDADPYKKIQIRGTIAGDTIVFNSSAIPIGNFSAIIFSYSPSFGLAYSSLINLTCLDSSAMYTQGNYSYQLPFPLNTTHIVQLNIEHTITQRDQNVAFDLYNIEPANSDTRYSLVYLVLANATVAKEFHVDVSTTEGELYNSTITFEVHANMPNTINFTVPVYYENGSLISEFKVTLSVGNDSLTVTVRPHELYFYDLRIWVGSGNGIWDSIMSHNPDPYGTIWASLSCGIGSFIGLASFGTTTVTEKTVLFGSSLVFDSVKMAISPKLDTVTAIKWAGVPLISGAQAVYAPMSMDYPPGSWADAYRKGFVPITLITCLSDYSKAMERWWKEGVERHILQPIGTMQSTKTAAIYCTNTPVVQARFSTVSPSGTRGSPLDVIQKACIITRFTLPWKRDTYRPLDVSLSLNGQPIGYLSEVVPEGHYVFQINPSILNFASSGIATNTITLATTHQNGGHYTVVSDITVMIVYQGINLSVVASTQEEANALVNNMTQTLLANWPNPSVFAEDIKANATVREGIQILNITLWNLGAAYANYVPLSICDGNTTIAHILAFIPPFQNVTIPIEWKATAGYHAIQAIVDPQNLQNRLDNENNQAQISITVLALNVAIANATYTKNVVGQGFSFSVSVTAANRGDFTETFNVTVYANTTIIASQNVTLSAGDSTLVTFTCNTTVFALGNYTISAYAWPVLGETNIQDNNFTAGTVRVGIPGDVDPADGYVGIDDIFNIATHFAQEPNHPNWNPIYDLNNDLYVGIDDIFTAAQHFGQEDP